MLTGTVGAEVESGMRSVCSQPASEVTELNIQSDHIHLRGQAAT